MSVRVVAFAPGSFGSYLQSKGFSSFKDVPPLYVTMVKRLQLHGDVVAPNSPVLAACAKELGLPLSEVQAFAKAPPLAEKWLKKVQSQLDRGTIPRGEKTAWNKGNKGKNGKRKGPAPGAGGAKGSPLTQYLHALTGVSMSTLARRLGVKAATMSRLSAGQLAVNHPLVPALADALGVEAAGIARSMTFPALGEGRAASLAERMRPLKPFKYPAGKKTPKEPGVAVVHVPVHVPKDGKQNGHVTKRAYNKLRTTSLALREAARSIATTLNMCAMEGATVTPPLPLKVLHTVLLDYLDLKGVRGIMLVDPDFATMFDPRE